MLRIRFQNEFIISGIQHSHPEKQKRGQEFGRSGADADNDDVEASRPEFPGLICSIGKQIVVAAVGSQETERARERETNIGPLPARG